MDISLIQLALSLSYNFQCIFLTFVVQKMTQINNIHIYLLMLISYHPVWLTSTWKHSGAWLTVKQQSHFFLFSSVHQDMNLSPSHLKVNLNDKVILMSTCHLGCNKNLGQSFLKIVYSTSFWIKCDTFNQNLFY